MGEKPRGLAEMCGDALREIAVLVLVFGLLDRYASKDGTPEEWTVAILSVSLLSFVAGVVIELIRRQ